MLTPLGSSKNNGHMLSPNAQRLFERMLARAHWKKLTGYILRRSRKLNALDATRHQRKLVNRFERGVEAVCLDCIRGTLNKPNDFDIEFYPMQKHSEWRWSRLAAAMMDGENIPPVELVQVGETYYVVDGHHRVSVARALRHAYIDAVVTVLHLDELCSCGDPACAVC
jgi:hypothetical protein